MAAVQAVAANRTRIGQPLQTAGLRDRLLAQMEHPRWAEVANRCLSCGNCTLACPTCFCTSVERATDLAGSEAVNERVWDSCFSPGFAKVAGGDFRAQPKHRYRQWLTHKFASWWDQFGSSGCTGCGRCITFCPVGIDVREELSVDRAGAAAPRRAEVRAHRRRPPGLRDGADRRQAGGDARHDDPAARRSRRRAHRRRPGPVRDGRAAQPSRPRRSRCRATCKPDGLLLTIRAAGPATKAIVELPVGATVGIRGPVGIGWPHEPAVRQGRRRRDRRHGPGAAAAAARPFPRRAFEVRRHPAALRRAHRRRHAVHRGARALGQGRRVRGDLPLAVAPPGRRRRRCRPLDGERDPPRVLGRHRTPSPTSAAPSG